MIKIQRWGLSFNGLYSTPLVSITNVEKWTDSSFNPGQILRYIGLNRNATTIKIQSVAI